MQLTTPQYAPPKEVSPINCILSLVNNYFLCGVFIADIDIINVLIIQGTTTNLFLDPSIKGRIHLYCHSNSVLLQRNPAIYSNECPYNSRNDDSSRMQLVGFLTHPYPPGLKKELLRMSLEGTVGEICRYHTLLGRLFAEAARAVVAKQHMEMESITVIGSHGYVDR